MKQAGTRSAIRSILRALSAADEQISASAAMTSDGLVLASILQDGVDVDRFGAMCASLLALADRASMEIDRGELSQVLIEGSHGAVLLVHAGPDAVLAVSSNPGAQIGKIFIEARRAAQKLRECLGCEAANRNP
jgi:predicted regulator of Ras-like GTPase activity (Roadblock/LC7/MglB family)